MSRPIIATLASLFYLSGCSAPPAECTPEQCAKLDARPSPNAQPPVAQPAPAPAAAPAQATLTDFEQQTVNPMLQDLRDGVRPFKDKAVGVCKGQGKECEDYVGMDAGQLPPGDYMVRAELHVPQLGKDWTVNFATECVTTRKSGDSETSTTSARDKDYKVSYRGADRGYRLSPLHKITSPSPQGAQVCTFTLTARHADGDKVYKGGWSVPAE